VSIVEAVVLGIVQGATEFLPVSSSGHLALVSRLLHISQLPLAFVVVVHFGTLIGVFAYYWQDFAQMLKSLVVWKTEDQVEGEKLTKARRLVGLLLVGTIPAAVLGYLFEDVVAGLFNSPVAVGLALIATGLVLVAVNWLAGHKHQSGTTVGDVVIIGLGQAVALVPGLSRSGCTIAAGLARGLQRDWAPKFAFLLSVPVILGGTVLEATRLAAQPPQSAMLAAYLVGGIVAAISGYVAINVVVRAVRGGNLIYFAGYCVLLGGLTVLVTLAAAL